MSGAEIGGGSIVCRSSAAVATEVNHEVVLMNLERDRCYGLGSTGSEIWRRLQAPIRVSELSTQLEGEFESAAGQIEQDLLRTLRELADEGLIEVTGGGE
jgi:Coenzyme PQQ synthesis protein D (PqqD)